MEKKVYEFIRKRVMRTHSDVMLFKLPCLIKFSEVQCSRNKCDHATQNQPSKSKNFENFCVVGSCVEIES